MLFYHIDQSFLVLNAILLLLLVGDGEFYVLNFPLAVTYVACGEAIQLYLFPFCHSPCLFVWSFTL
jgi:hypothetical protein